MGPLYFKVKSEKRKSFKVYSRERYIGTFTELWATTSIELKESEKELFFIKDVGVFHILFERRYEETYRIELYITE